MIRLRAKSELTEQVRPTAGPATSTSACTTVTSSQTPAATAVELPRPWPTRCARWTPTRRTRGFLALAGRHRLAALWLLALDSGMRQGEMLALEWPDVDFANGTVSVTKSVRTGDGDQARA